MRHEKKTFKAQPVVLDGNEYIDCTFEDCTFVYAGGRYSLDRANVVSSFSLGLRDAAENTAQLLRFLAGFPEGQVVVASVLGLIKPKVHYTMKRP